MTKRQIIGTVWLHPAQQGRMVGIVAAVTEEHLPAEERTWCAYTGIISFPLAEDMDAQLLANVGAKLSADQARGFFPDQDITKYKSV